MNIIKIIERRLEVLYEVGSKILDLINKTIERDYY